MFEIFLSLRLIIIIHLPFPELARFIKEHVIVYLSFSAIFPKYKWIKSQENTYLEFLITYTCVTYLKNNNFYNISISVESYVCYLISLLLYYLFSVNFQNIYKDNNKMIMHVKH